MDELSFAINRIKTNCVIVFLKYMNKNELLLVSLRRMWHEEYDS